MDTFGLLPAGIRERVERDAEIDRHIQSAKRLAEEIKKIDQRADLTFVNDRAPEGYGWVPGRWHIVIRNDALADTYRPIVGPNNSYREPSLYDLEALKRDDLQNPRSGAMDRLDPSGEREKAARERSNALKAEQRRDEVVENTRAIGRLAGEGGMTKRKWGTGKKGVAGS